MLGRTEGVCERTCVQGCVKGEWVSVSWVLGVAVCEVRVPGAHVSLAQPPLPHQMCVQGGGPGERVGASCSSALPSLPAWPSSPGTRDGQAAPPPDTPRVKGKGAGQAPGKRGKAEGTELLPAGSLAAFSISARSPSRPCPSQGPVLLGLSGAGPT